MVKGIILTVLTVKMLEEIHMVNRKKDNANKTKLLIFCKNRLHNMTSWQNYKIKTELQKTEL